MQKKDRLINKEFPVLNLHCAACAARVERVLNQCEGVVDASVNVATNMASIAYEGEKITPEQLKAVVIDAGYDLVVIPEEDALIEAQVANEKHLKQLKRKALGAVLLSLPVFIYGMFLMHRPEANWVMLIFATPVVFWAGRDFFVSAWQQLKKGATNMDTLVALSVSVSYLFSLFNMFFPEVWHKRGLEAHVYFEASAVIIAFILLGRLLEERAKQSTRGAIRSLMGMQPSEATRILPSGDLEVIPIGIIQPGDLLLAKPGERIAVDGIVEKGESYVDESMLSGEPIPVAKGVGSSVYAASINQQGSFRYRAESVGSDTLFARIIALVKQAQGSKAPIQKLVDRIASVFVPIIIGVALLAFTLWLLWGGENSVSHAVLAFVTVVVIACPCALGLATPTAIVVGMGKGAEQGILIKDAHYLEMARRVDAVILDKTGTLTKGHPSVERMVVLSPEEQEKQLAILLAMEQLSDHPLAKAIVEHLSEQVATESLPQVDKFETIMGRGIKAEVDGVTYSVGNEKILAERGASLHKSLRNELDQWEAEGKTVICFSSTDKFLAYLVLSDALKPESKEAIASLKKRGIELYLLSGDNEASTRSVAQTVGIKKYRGGMLPSEKYDVVKELQEKGKVVAMVGDGINDSAALAQADLSIAMGAGSDVAIEVAKLTIVSGDLRKIPLAIELSRQTALTIRQNLFWAFIYNLIAVPIAAGVLYPFTGFLLNPMLAGAAMALSSVSVVANSLRLKIKPLSAN